MNPFVDFVILCRKNNNHLFTFVIFQRISEKQKIKRRFISLLHRNVIKLWRLCSSEVLNVNVQRFCFLNPGLLHIQDTHGKTIKIWLVQYILNVYEMPRVPPTLHKCHSSFALRFNSYSTGAATSSPYSLAASLELCTIWFKGFSMLYHRQPPVTLIRSKWRLTDDAETDLCYTGR